MNNSEIKGYLLACCDEIDRMVEIGKLTHNDMAHKMSAYLREYFAKQDDCAIKDATDSTTTSRIGFLNI